MKIWYDKPAIEADVLDQNTAMLPIGNGFMAAMISGQLEKERIQFNEETLWTGGPGGKSGYADHQAGGGTGYQGDKPYQYGHKNEGQVIPSLDDLLTAMKNGTFETSMMDGMLGTDIGYGSYQNFGYLHLDHQLNDEIPVQDYRRELDLERGVTCTSYQQGEVEFKREFFASYSDRLIVVKISSTGSHCINLGTSIKVGQADVDVDYHYEIRNDFGWMEMDGVLNDNLMKFNAQFFVTQTGGKMSQKGKKLEVRNADSVTIVFLAGTDYRHDFSDPETANYRTGIDPKDQVYELGLKGIKKGFDQLFSMHLADYKTLMNRMELNLTSEIPTIPTDQLLLDYGSGKNAEYDRYLEMLLFQYGRYLLISSSRPGTLPANLQGKWNVESNPPWSADYHYNINLQMNYWPAGNTNLTECLLPLIDFIGKLIPSGHVTAKKYFGIDQGWTLHTSGNIFGLTAPGWGIGWGWSPANNAFICQNLWDYYQFSDDLTTLRADIYPTIKSAALFWSHALRQDGDLLVVVPSLSPEQGPVTYATAYDQQLIWELFNFTVKAIEVLEKDEDLAFKNKLIEQMAKLKPVQIGDFGQIMEWRDEPTDFDEKYDKEHRHISQLVGLYPGTLINRQNEAFMEAAKVTLNRRGDAATGWSMGWKINFWARVGDGNHAHQLIQNLIRENLATNLFGLHGMSDGDSVFQIDANFGYTAGVAEMLLQSHMGIQSHIRVLEILPALPDAWQKEGEVIGIRARGGYELEISWDEEDDGVYIFLQTGASTPEEITVRCSRFAGKTIVVEGPIEGEPIIDNELVEGNEITIAIQPETGYYIYT